LKIENLKFKTPMKTLLTVVTLAASLALASAQGLVNDVYALTNLPTIMAPSVISNITTTPIRIRQNQGVSFATALAVSNSGTALLTFYFNLSQDGTNYTTTNPLQFNVPCTGTTGVRAFTNFTDALLNNAAAIRLSIISNANANSLYLTNVVAGRGR
jgi:hypothetical protein